MSRVDKNWNDIAKEKGGVSVRVVRKGQQPNQTRSNAPPPCWLWPLNMQEQAVMRMSHHLSLLNGELLSSAAGEENARTPLNVTKHSGESKRSKTTHSTSLPKPTAQIATANARPIENELHQSRSNALLQVNLKSKTMVRLHGDRSSLLNALMWATSRHNGIHSQVHPSRSTNRDHDRSHARGPKN